MRIHHLNCGTMRPPSARLINGSGSALGSARIVCHCLLVEAPDGLVLVDTGVGRGEIEQPLRRLGPVLFLLRPRLDPAETAASRLAELGFAPRDVRHIVLTHLDFDHAGGLVDFPEATVHVLREEHDAAMQRRTLNEKGRYIPAQWAHGPRWSVHDRGGDRWNGFESVRCIGGGTAPEVLLVPTFGHTRGHCAVAVRGGEGWLLHCGDSYFFHGETDPVAPRCTLGLSAFQRITAIDDGARRANRDRLRELARRAGPDGPRLFCAHDPDELARMQASGAPVATAAPA